VWYAKVNPNGIIPATLDCVRDAPLHGGPGDALRVWTAQASSHTGITKAGMDRVAPILVVDDNAETSAALTAVLQIRGYETVAARDGLEALAELRAGLRPSLIVLDWMMPNLDGRGFLEELATDLQLEAIPVIIYSAVGARIVADGVEATLSKSVDPQVLLDLVADIAAHRRRNGGRGNDGQA